MILCAKNSFLLPHWLDDTSRNNIRYIKSDLMHMTTDYQKVFMIFTWPWRDGFLELTTNYLS